jgi:hypothetical protein
VVRLREFPPLLLEMTTEVPSSLLKMLLLLEGL